MGSGAQVRPPSVSFVSPILKVSATLPKSRFSAAGAVGTAQIGRVPAGSMIVAVTCQVEKAFSGDTSASFDVGVTGTVNRFVGGANVFVQGFKGVAFSSEGNLAAQTIVQDEDVIGTVTSGSDFAANVEPSAKLKVQVHYIRVAD